MKVRTVYTYIHVRKYMRASVKDGTGREDVTHPATTKPNRYIPNKLHSRLGLLVFVSVRFGHRCGLSVRNMVLDPNTGQTQQRGSPSVFIMIKIKHWDVVLPQQCWQAYEWPADVQPAVATVTNNRGSGRCDGNKCSVPALHSGKYALFPSFQTNLVQGLYNFLKINVSTLINNNAHMHCCH